eukprot:17821-Heterococcus_DN1.PRE.2
MNDCKRDDTTVSSSNAAQTANCHAKVRRMLTYTRTLALSGAVYKCALNKVQHYSRQMSFMHRFAVSQQVLPKIKLVSTVDRMAQSMC